MHICDVVRRPGAVRVLVPEVDRGTHWQRGIALALAIHVSAVAQARGARDHVVELVRVQVKLRVDLRVRCDEIYLNRAGIRGARRLLRLRDRECRTKWCVLWSNSPGSKRHGECYCGGCHSGPLPTALVGVRHVPRPFTVYFTAL